VSNNRIQTGLVTFCLSETRGKLAEILSSVSVGKVKVENFDFSILTGRFTHMFFWSQSDSHKMYHFSHFFLNSSNDLAFFFTFLFLPLCKNISSYSVGILNRIKPYRTVSNDRIRT